MARGTAKTSGAVAVTTASGAVLGENVSRRTVDIVNDGANIVYLQFQTGGTAPTAVANQGIRLNPNGGAWSAPVGPNGSCMFTGAIAAISTVGASALTVLEI